MPKACSAIRNDQPEYGRRRRRLLHSLDEAMSAVSEEQ